MTKFANVPECCRICLNFNSEMKIHKITKTTLEEVIELSLEDLYNMLKDKFNEFNIHKSFRVDFGRENPKIKIYRTTLISSIPENPIGMPDPDIKVKINV